jgi:hypothetical protein
MGVNVVSIVHQITQFFPLEDILDTKSPHVVIFCSFQFVNFCHFNWVCHFDNIFFNTKNQLTIQSFVDNSRIMTSCGIELTFDSLKNSVQLSSLFLCYRFFAITKAQEQCSIELSIRNVLDFTFATYYNTMKKLYCIVVK